MLTGQAILMAANIGKRTHKNRPYHGFVFIYGDCEKDDRFDDGRVLHTRKNSLFYLPKGSSYYVDTDHSGECPVISPVNFDKEKPVLCSHNKNDPDHTPKIKREHRKGKKSLH